VGGRTSVSQFCKYRRGGEVISFIGEIVAESWIVVTPVGGVVET
jgi:hypothetical protein